MSVFDALELNKKYESLHNEQHQNLDELKKL